MGITSKWKSNCMNGGEDGHIPDAPDLAEFESIKHVLEELHRRYDDEDRRRVAINAKANSLLALNAILISIISGLMGADEPLAILTVIVLILSGIVMLLTVRSQEYSRPLEQVGNVYAYADESQSEFHADFAELYETSIVKNEQINNIKYDRFRIGFYLTVVAILILFLGITLPNYTNFYVISGVIMVLALDILLSYNILYNIIF